MKKLNKRLIIGALIIAAAVIAIALSLKTGGKVSTDSLETTEALKTSVYDTIDAKAYIVRDEKLLTNNASGNIVPMVANGVKVNAGTDVAAVFYDSESAEKYSTLTYLESTLQGYSKIDSQTMLDNVDVDRLAQSIDGDFDDILNSVYNGDFSQLGDRKLEYLIDISRRQIVMGNQIDCTPMINSITSEIEKISSGCVPSSTVKAGTAGFYCDKADGYEGLITTADLDSITSETVANAVEAAPDKVSDKNVGKVMDGFVWYIITAVDSDAINTLNEGDSVKVMLNASGSLTAQCKVKSLKKEKSTGKTVAVFSCNNVDASVLSLRIIDARILMNEYEGIKVPRSAIMMNEGCECAYVRVGNVTKLRYLNVIYSCDDYVLASDPGEDSEIKLPGAHIKVHDNIILNAKGMKTNG